MTNTKHKLPEGWLTPEMRSVLEIKYGKSLPKKKRIAGKVPVYGSNGIVGYHDTAITGGRTIVIGRKGSVGEIHLSESLCWPIDTTYYIDSFHGTDPNFVSYALKQLNLPTLESSSAIPGINRDRIYDLNFPLVPLAEQKRIGDVIEKLFVRVNNAKDRLDNATETMKRLRKSVLNVACTGKLTEDWRGRNPEAEPSKKLLSRIQFEVEGTNKIQRKFLADELEDEPFDLPSTWSWTCTANVCYSVTDGDHQSPPKSSSGIPFILISNINTGAIDLSNTMFVPQSYYDKIKEKRKPKKDNILFSVTGSYGIPAYIDSDIDFCFQRHIALLKVHSCISSKYLFRVMQSQLIYDQATRVATGTAQLTVSLTGLRQLRIPLPPIDEQQEIVGRVERLFVLADKIEDRIVKARNRVEKLTQSVLTKAFKGELVPTEAELARIECRNYETAEQLLGRIKSEKAKDKLAKAKKKKAKAKRKSFEDIFMPYESLFEIISKSKGGVEPEGLLDASYFTVDTIEAFYEELAKLEKAGKIEDYRPNNKTSLLRIKK